MRFKELTVMGILAIFSAVIIISFQENDDPIVTIELQELPSHLSEIIKS